MTDPSEPMSIAELGGHPGLHVLVNLNGKTIGGESFRQDQWLPGVIVGQSPLGTAVTIKLDTPIGARPATGLMHRGTAGQDMVTVSDPDQVRAQTLPQSAPAGIPQDIVALARAGKTSEAIKRYRALNGATLDEARAAIEQM